MKLLGRKHLGPSSTGLMHRQAIQLMLKDFERTLAYVEPHEKNMGVFSHRFFELLLRASTEFESLSKYILEVIELGDPTDRSTIKDYFKLCEYYELRDCQIEFYRWNPGNLLVNPFSTWKTKERGPDWYRAYNLVKHSRQKKFQDANLGNVISALAANIILLCQCFEPRFFEDEYDFRQQANGAQAYWFSQSPFAFRRQKDACGSEKDALSKR